LQGRADEARFYSTAVMMCTSAPTEAQFLLLAHVSLQPFMHSNPCSVLLNGSARYLLIRGTCISFQVGIGEAPGDIKIFVGLFPLDRCETIEATRLLLSSAQNDRETPWGRNRWLGCCFSVWFMASCVVAYRCCGGCHPIRDGDRSIEPLWIRLLWSRCAPGYLGHAGPGGGSAFAASRFIPSPVADTALRRSNQLVDRARRHVGLC